ncbi:MAG TPA: ABC transporter ATP-binding protein [Firmicutes bacterium]|nr:ABC transporter ATP-binding protein [Bacillota bacterium]
MSMAKSLVEFKCVSKSYGEKTALEDVSFEVPKGVIFGCVGPNGAGKTTVIRLMLGLLDPDDGVVRVFGQDPRSLSPVLRRRIGHILEAQCIYSDLTVRQNLNFFASIYGIDGYDNESLRAILEELKIVDYADKPAGWLSKGMRQQLAIRRAMLTNPDLLILDEPTSGLDPIYQRRIMEILRSYRDTGDTVFLCSHDMTQIERLCDMVLFLNRGESIGVVSAHEFRQRSPMNAWIVTAVCRKSKERLLAKLRGKYVCVDSSANLSFEVTVPDGGESDFLVFLGSEAALIQQVRRVVPTFEKTFFQLIGEDDG